MLIVVMFVSFIVSHVVLQNALSAIDSAIGPPTAIAAVVVYVALILVLGRLGAFLPASSRRVVISITYGGILGALFNIVASIRALGVTQLESDGEYAVPLLLLAFLLWGACTHTMIATVFTLEARNSFWKYVQDTYSTFRKQ